MEFGFVVLMTSLCGVAFGDTFVDLSHHIAQGTPCWPGLGQFEYEFTVQGLNEAGLWFAAGRFATAEHCGTHCDSPVHVAANRWSLHEIPAHHLVASGCVIDVSSKTATDPDYQLTAQDIKNWESQHGSIADIVFVNFGWAKHFKTNMTYYFTGPNGSLGPYGNDSTNLHFPGIHRDAARWIVENRPSVKGVGVDTLSMDYGPSQNFDAHRILYQHNIYGVENLNNLDKLPPRDFELMVLPLNLKNGTGSPARVFARIYSVNYNYLYVIALISFLCIVIVLLAIQLNLAKQHYQRPKDL